MDPQQLCILQWCIRARWTKLPLVVLSFVLLGNFSSADDELLRAFQSEYPVAAAEIAAAFEGPLKIRGVVSSGRSTEEKIAYFYGTRMRIEVQFDNDKHGVVCVADKYLFSAGRIGNGRYILSDLMEYSGKLSDNLDRLPDDPDLKDLLASFRANLVISGRPLVEWMDKDGFKLLDAREVDIDGARCVELKLIIPHPKRELPIKVALDPGLGWCIRQTDLTTADGKSLKTHLLYNSPVRLMPSSLKRTLTGEKTLEITFSDWDTSPIDVADFTLAHYGFPELEKPKGWSYWIGTVLLLMGLIAVSVYYFRQKRK